jgi:DNA-binding NarL/FixJ family response regulator
MRVAVTEQESHQNASPPTIRLMIADDHPILRAGVASVLALEPDLELVAEAADGEEAVALFEKLAPDVTLIDLQMPRMSGVEAIIRIREIDPSAKLIVLTTYSGDVQALRAIGAGASGYLLKSSLRLEMLDVIRHVHGGAMHIPPEIAADVETLHGLTAREVAVLALVAEGRSNKRAALSLGISEETIKAHLKSAFAKLGVRDRTHAVTVAARRGILDLTPVRLDGSSASGSRQEEDADQD